MVGKKFADRVEYTEYIQQTRNIHCDKGMTIFLFGLGGIGKSTLLLDLSRWPSSALLECDQHANFDDRLWDFVRRIRSFGVRTSRFEMIWVLKSRYMDGHESVLQPKKWRSPLFEFILEKTPVLNRVYDFAKFVRLFKDAISNSQFSEAGTWLRINMGPDWEKEWIDKLDSIPASYWPEYYGDLLSALRGDIEAQESSRIETLLLMIDAFEHMDYEEQAVWLKFVFGIPKCLVLIGGRLPPRDNLLDEIDTKCVNVTQLDHTLLRHDVLNLLEMKSFNEAGCREMLESRGISDTAFQDVIIESTSGCHHYPPVVDAICDTIRKGITKQQVEELELATLDEGKALKRILDVLLSRVGPELRRMIDIASILPYFDQKIIGYMLPGIPSTVWPDLSKFSFLKARKAGYYEINEIAGNLIRVQIRSTESDPQRRIDEIIALSEKAFTNTSNPIFVALCVCVVKVFDEFQAFHTLVDIERQLREQDFYEYNVAFLELVDFDDDGLDALRLQYLGINYKNIRQYAKAKATLESSIFRQKDLVAKGQNYSSLKPQMEFARYHLGELYLTLGLLDEAEKNLNKAISFFKSWKPSDPLNNKPLGIVGLAKYDLLRISMMRGRSSAVMWSMKDMLSFLSGIEGKIPDLHSELDIDIKNLLAQYLFESDNLKDAANLFGSLVEVYQESETKNDFTLATYLKSWGLVLIYLSEFDEAKSKLIEAHELSMSVYKGFKRRESDNGTKKVEVPLEFLRFWADLREHFGFLYSNWGELRFVEKKGEKGEMAVSLTEMISEVDLRCEAIEKDNEIRGLWLKGEDAYRKALELYGRIAKRDYTSLMGKHGIVKVYNHLGLLYKRMGSLEKALTQFQEGIKFYNEIEDALTQKISHVDYCALLYSRAWVEMIMGQVNAAEKKLERVLKLIMVLVEDAPEIHQRQLAEIYHLSGVFHLEKRDFDQAEDMFLNALAIYSHLDSSISQWTDFMQHSFRGYVAVRMLREEISQDEAERLCLEEIDARLLDYEVPSQESIELMRKPTPQFDPNFTAKVRALFKVQDDEEDHNET